MSSHVIIVGGGFGGLEAAFSLKSLLKPSSRITLFDRGSCHAFIPSIHLIISGKTTARELQIPLKTVLGAAGISFIQDEVLHIDREKREVTCATGTWNYDYLLLSSGAESNFLALPGAEEHSCRFRTPEDAGRIRERLLTLMNSSRRPCRIALAGAGTEGVEVIGELLDLVRTEERERELQSGSITIDLIEGKNRLLPALPLAAQTVVEDYLQQQGVTFTVGDRIAQVRKESIVLASGREQEASILIWSGGIQPSGLIRGLSSAKDPWGWLKVTDRLHVPDDDRVYGIGDAASIYADDGPLAVQRLAYHAQDQARVASLNIAYHLQRREQIAYVPKNKPQLISLGGAMGVFTLEDRVYSGSWVVPLKKTIERSHLMTYLTKPVTSAVLSRLPGAGILKRLRTVLPL